MVEVNYSALGFAMTQEQADLVKETLATEVIDEEEDGFSNVEITEGKLSVVYANRSVIVSLRLRRM